MPVRFSEDALVDLKEIFTYVAANNRDAATKLIRRICGVAVVIGKSPHIGQSVDWGRFKKLLIGNYAMYYEITEKEIIIQQIRHGARRPWGST